jgi:cyclophilin family peptidyl-prolyl cis-trans isomerase
MVRKLAVVIALLAVHAAVAAAPDAPRAPASPVLVLDTVKGTIEIELYQADAPRSVAHILDLVRRNFYRGLRFHRVEASLVQVGDPMTRDVSRRDSWGAGGSGHPIGVAEISKKHLHVRGTVGLASAAGPEYADSQFYIMKRASPSLDGKYAIIGHVISGMAVVDKLQVTDILKNVTIKGAGQR